MYIVHVVGCGLVYDTNRSKILRHAGVAGTQNLPAGSGESIREHFPLSLVFFVGALLVVSVCVRARRKERKADP